MRNQPLFDYIKEIKSSDVKIGLLSNAGKDMPGALFSEAELNGEVFDAVVISAKSATPSRARTYTIICRKKSAWQMPTVYSLMTCLKTVTVPK